MLLIFFLKILIIDKRWYLKGWFNVLPEASGSYRERIPVILDILCMFYPTNQDDNGIH